MSSGGCVVFDGAVKKYIVLATKFSVCVPFMCFVERMRNTFVESIYFKLDKELWRVMVRLYGQYTLIKEMPLKFRG
jgi:hypothetical protein